jgi:hypothetical protein
LPNSASKARPPASQDNTALGGTASIALDPQTNELFLSDGYFNHRLIVLDANTLSFKRMWGAYGKPASDTKLPNYNPKSEQFANPVHCVRIANDGMVYVCDRTNDRIQVFRKDGTFVKELVVRPETHGTGSSYDLAFWPDPQSDLSDHRRRRRWRGCHRAPLRWRRGRLIRALRQAGGQFHNIHQIVSDSKGNIYTGEVDVGMRIQKFTPNMAPAK